jgi:ribosome-associated protein
MEEFNLGNNEFIELNNLLKVMGLCDSGGIAKTVIAEGRVRVNGNVELRKRYKVRKGQLVEFEGHKIILLMIKNYSYIVI